LNGHHAYFDEEDLYQEALTHLWGAFRKGSIDDKRDSYILQGCYYHLKNHLRKVRENAVFVSLNDARGGKTASPGGMKPPTNPRPSRVLRTKEVPGDRRRMQFGPGPPGAELLMEDLSVREVGTRLGISHVMVLKIRNRIRDNYFRR
jgi:DNA-directed RNA polymerase specialized sigma24 family protein